MKKSRFLVYFVVALAVLLNLTFVVKADTTADTSEYIENIHSYFDGNTILYYTYEVTTIDKSKPATFYPLKINFKVDINKNVVYAKGVSYAEDGKTATMYLKGKKSFSNDKAVVYAKDAVKGAKWKKADKYKEAVLGQLEGNYSDIYEALSDCMALKDLETVKSGKIKGFAAIFKFKGEYRFWHITHEGSVAYIIEDIDNNRVYKTYRAGGK